MKGKHYLTRKLVGYRNWMRRQWWCKKEGNKVLREEKSYISLLHERVNVTGPKEVLNIGFLFLSHFSLPKTGLVTLLLTPLLPSQILYPTNFLVREYFSLLVYIKI